ncbi:MAG TPA: hypothetical protein ENI64_09800 [Gammaproteobacteria bacterium]|nr:hypothetical protein [Gammaproteobacteria bacterium]
MILLMTLSMLLINLPSARASTDELLLQLQCTSFLKKFDRIVSHTATGDAQASPVTGFPYLRTSRFLVSFRDQVMGQAALRQWLGMMRQLDAQARAMEWSHLDAEWQAFIAAAKPVVMGNSSTMEAISQCGRYLVTKDLAKPDRLKALRDVVQVAGDYQVWKRITGLYYLTRYATLDGIEKLAELTHERYRSKLDELMPVATRKIFTPQATSFLGTDQLRSLMQNISRNPLQIPLPSKKQAELLLQHYAPVWVPGQTSENDSIGKPSWLTDQSWPYVDTQQPVTYTLLSHTRFQGITLLQLVYTIWFPGRTAESAIDSLAGHLDGITWRVTLDPQGQPLIYDSMHNCGCYHLFFPVADSGLEPEPVNADSATVEERALVPQQVATLQQGERVHLYITAGSHDLVRVRVRRPEPSSVSYELEDYNELRSLATESDVRRSLFDPAGLVPGTERLESLYLWPMGVLRPGAMRQWGHHATAFVGRRHFDQPDLMERYFVYRQ